MPHPDRVIFGDASTELLTNGHPVPEIDVTPRPLTSPASDLPK
jgi:hypothetical protein